MTAAALVHVEAKFEFTPEQRQMIRDQFANGATESEFAVLMEVARARRLNPLMKQIHFVKRWDSMKGRDVWSTQTSIDGLRAIAERTGEYDGQDEPEFTYNEKKQLICAKVRVYRKNVGRPFVGVAHFDEYAQRKKGGELTQFWRDKPHVMLAKCAEALGLRKAFPEDMAGLYVQEEMDAADNPPRVDAPVAEVRQLSAKQESDSCKRCGHANAIHSNGKCTGLKTDVESQTDYPCDCVVVESTPAETIEKYIARFEGAVSIDALKQIGKEVNQDKTLTAASRTQLSLKYVECKRRIEAPAAQNGATT